MIVFVTEIDIIWTNQKVVIKCTRTSNVDIWCCLVIEIELTQAKCNLRDR